jgi:hypothetical protein
MAFTFHANTLAFSGQLDEPSDRRTKYLPSQASVALPPEGGVGESTVQNYSEEGVSFYRAESRCFGNSFEDRIYNTFANVMVTGLDIRGVIQADVLNSSVTSVNRRERGSTTESRITIDANIVGLVINGHPIEVDLDTERFRRHATFTEFVNSFQTLSLEEMTELAAAYNWPLEECMTTKEENGVTVTTFHVPKRCSTGLRASLLRDTCPRLAEGEIPGIRREGFTIEVADFGLIHLGEVLIKAGRRRVNLLRVELGKTLEGKSTPRASLATAAAAPRIQAVALGEAPTQPSLVRGGGFTLCSGEGNGTDFLP